MEELKKCPFCGGEANTKMECKHSTGWTIWCECYECHAQTNCYYPELDREDTALNNIDFCRKLAIEAWNRRAEE